MDLETSMIGDIKLDFKRRFGLNSELVTQLDELDCEFNELFIRESEKLIDKKSPRGAITLSWGLFIAFLCYRIERHGFGVFKKSLLNRASHIDEPEDIEDLYVNVDDSEILTQASKEGIIKEIMKDRAEALLDRRNDAAHYNSKQIRKSDAESYSRRVNNLIEDIKSLDLLRNYNQVMRELKRRDEDSIPHYDFDSDRIAEIGDPIWREIQQGNNNRNLLVFIKEVLSGSNEEENLVKYSRIAIDLFRHKLDGEYSDNRDLVEKLLDNSFSHIYFPQALERDETREKFCIIVKEVDESTDISRVASMFQKSYFQQDPKTKLKLIKSASRNQDLIAAEEFRVSFEDELDTFNNIDQEVIQRYKEAGYNI